MNKLLSLLSLILFLLLPACTDQDYTPDDGKGRDYPTDATFDLIDRSMSFMNSDPVRAHRMLDSIAGAGLMTRQRCDYFHAMVKFSGEGKYDSALEICDRLLDAGVFGDDRFLEEELCVLASNITMANQSHLATLKYANRGISLCHGDERMRGDEATLMARVGVAEQALGRIEQARETYDRAYQLLKGTSTFADLVALITLQKRQMQLYNEMKEYDTMISICHEIEQLVERFERDPSFVGQRPATMQEPGPATKDFADFYRCQVYGHLARAYRERVEQGLAVDAKAETDSVRSYMQKLLHNDGAQTSMALINSMPEMQFIGLKSEFERTRPIAEEVFKADSLVSEYVVYLTLLANDAESRRDLQASTNYLRRAKAVSDSINQQEMVRMLGEQMSINMVQEQQLARQDAESQLERQKLMNRLLTFVLIAIFMAGTVIGLLVYKNQRTEEIIKITQQDLEETKEEVEELAYQLEEARIEKALDNAQSLYERIVLVMEEQKLYLNTDLDIRQLAEAVLSSRSVVSTCINRISGMNFRQWLSEYRLNLFEKMLKQYPDIPIEDLVLRCGYKDQSTFRRHFKDRHGMTVLKFKKKEEEGESEES